MADDAVAMTARPGDRCWVCGASATHRCERCQRPICPEHTCEPSRMSWQTFSNGPGRGATTWRRYLTDGQIWIMCPACAEQLVTTETREEARDRWNLWVRRLILIGTVLVFIGSCWLLSYLASH